MKSLAKIGMASAVQKFVNAPSEPMIAENAVTTLPRDECIAMIEEVGPLLHPMPADSVVDATNYFFSLFPGVDFKDDGLTNYRMLVAGLIGGCSRRVALDAMALAATTKKYGKYPEIADVKAAIDKTLEDYQKSYATAKSHLRALENQERTEARKKREADERKKSCKYSRENMSLEEQAEIDKIVSNMMGD